MGKTDVLGTQVTVNATVWKPDPQANEDLYVTDLYACGVRGFNSPSGVEIKTIAQGHELVGFPKLNKK